ncbi:hypothetical protein ABZ923_23375 [Streptomyces sp. NPDC046881]|uniref:hypothetical protein n=1 Tax=Streptomyces sp. NPDC046881 TaxID=3155374 RepID=UPI0033F182E3
MRAHRAKRAFACVATGFLLAGGTAISTASTAAAAAPAATTISGPSSDCSNWQWVNGYYDVYHRWHKGHWVCRAVRID